MGESKSAAVAPRAVAPQRAAAQAYIERSDNDEWVFAIIDTFNLRHTVFSFSFV